MQYSCGRFHRSPQFRKIPSPYDCFAIIVWFPLIHPFPLVKLFGSRTEGGFKITKYHIRAIWY